LNRKGYTLLVVLIFGTVLTLIATTLWASVNTETQLTENVYRVGQAKMAAQSGINHFIALNLRRRELTSNQVIPETRLSRTMSYYVNVFPLLDNRYLVISWGLYRKAHRVIFKYPIRAIIDWDD